MAIMKGAGKVDEGGGGGAGPGRSGELLVPAGCGGELITRHYQMHKVSITYWKCQMRGNFSQYSFPLRLFEAAGAARKRGVKKGEDCCERKYAVRRTYVLAHM